MPKNIVICADGTGNTTIKGRGTNVFKLYEAVDANGHRADPTLTQQVAIYHDGVGTESLKWLRIFSGATGWGLSRNVKQLYGELARVYEPNDRIYLFGFSRGAFTVRTLAGLVITCGILDVSKYGSNQLFWKGVESTYAQYRRKYQTWLSRVIFGKRKPEAFPTQLVNEHCVTIPGFSDGTQPVIEFIGVWDTVDAVGLPLRLGDIINAVFWRFKFPDTSLSPRVGHAVHALAVDEARESFAPVLWNESVEDPSRPGRIEQVWFAGAHSNVGGGYPRQGMSLTALDWVMSRAEAYGLRFHEDVRILYREGADVNDKRYDSRAGLGVFYRWKPRDVQRLCEICGVRPKVHRSVFERVARNTEGYAPGSLPTRCDVVSSTVPDGTRNMLSAAIADIFGADLPLLRRYFDVYAVGFAGYLLLITSTIVVVLFMLMKFISDSRTQHQSLIQGILAIGLSSHWLTIAASTAWRHPWIIALAALSMFLLVSAEHRLDKFYSSFWHQNRKKLQAAM